MAVCPRQQRQLFDGAGDHIVLPRGQQAGERDNAILPGAAAASIAPARLRAIGFALVQSEQPVAFGQVALQFLDAVFGESA